jgi:16S rRNA (guanine527-N7)-methyltransferase
MTSEGMDSNGNYWRIDQWFPKLAPETHASLRTLHKELLFFNSKINLISPKTVKTADLTHIADGILGSQAVLQRASSEEIYDIGSGNGIPGIVLAILAPSKKFILVDSDTRKIEYLRHCISRIGLRNCTVLCSRLEDLPAGTIRCAASRGFASISKTLLLARRASADNCEFYHFKGPAWSSEVASIPSQIMAAWAPIHACDYPLPLGESIMSIVLTKKISEGS